MKEKFIRLPPSFGVLQITLSCVACCEIIIVAFFTLHGGWYYAGHVSPPEPVSTVRIDLIREATAENAEASAALGELLAESGALRADVKMVKSIWARRRWLDGLHLLFACGLMASGALFAVNYDEVRLSDGLKKKYKALLAALALREARFEGCVQTAVEARVTDLRSTLVAELELKAADLDKRRETVVLSEQRAETAANALRRERNDFAREKAEFADSQRRESEVLDRRRAEIDLDLKALELGTEVCSQLNALVVRFDAHLALDPEAGPVHQVMASFPATRRAMQFWRRYLKTMSV